MDKVYNAQEIEQRIYQEWLDKGSFTADLDEAKPSFSVVMPPPNITGKLHMGHALDNMMQDAFVRFKRMQGYSTLWVPGTDHASIATEVKIVDKLKAQGITKKDIGREEFLKKAWEWKDEFGGTIVSQLKKLGSSCDWSRERFTLDEGCSKAVLEAFCRLYEKGYIYKGDRIINWCPCCKTALSDAEVEYEQRDGHLWHIRYDFEDGSGGVTVATTRPETMLGDTAVAVHPDDDRYKAYIGKNLVLPLVGRKIPVVADKYVDMEFGSGAVKITPAHDPNDFEVGVRHKLPIIRIMDDAGVINEDGGKYQGMDRYEARKQVVEDLKALGNLVKIEDHDHNVGECYRCHTTVEPIISKQWFVDMNQMAKAAVEAVESSEVTFVPKRFDKIYFNWMNNIKDWCISRQLWWGHRIPAYYCDDCKEMTVSKSAVESCPKCGGHCHQDEDVLDTWFSSGLWPFSTLGWPDETPELRKYYPTSILVTAYDIIFFWVARMIVFGKEFMGDAPFANVIIHGIIRDSQGRKMSKSLGNGIDPLDVIEQYGADALRFSLARGTSPGNDMRYYEERVEHGRNFANKIWNASKFVLMSAEDKEYTIDEAKLDYGDKWMLSRLNTVIREVTDNLEDFELGLASEKVYELAWKEYCDWYIELCKSRLYSDDTQVKDNVVAVLLYGLKVILKLLHPFMPFVTEEIYNNLPGNDGSLMLSHWPEEYAKNFAEEAKQMEAVMDVIKAIRNIRADMNVAPSKKSTIYIVSDDLDGLKTTEAYLLRLGYGEKVVYTSSRDDVPKNAVSAVCSACEVCLPLLDLIDVETEKARLDKEKKRLEGEIKRGEGKLNNQGFLAKAPKELVEEERAKLDNYKDMYEKVKSQIEALLEM